jgi:hypothetical protein
VLARLITPTAATALGTSFAIENKAGAGRQHRLRLTAHDRFDAQHPGGARRQPVQDAAGRDRRREGKPGTISYASSGNGRSQHLSGVFCKQLTGAREVHVPYKSSAESLTPLSGQGARHHFENLAPALPHIKAGKLRALGITSDKRSSVVPMEGYPMRREVKRFRGATMAPLERGAPPTAVVAASAGERSHALDSLRATAMLLRRNQHWECEVICEAVPGIIRALARN